MKVLKEGRKQKGWSTERECTGGGNGNGGCGALLLVEEADIRRYSHTDISGYTDPPIGVFRCCACGVTTDMKDVPYDVLKDAKEWTSYWRRTGKELAVDNR